MSKETTVKRRVNRKKLKRVTEGFLSTVVDLTLFSLYLPLASFGKRPNSRDVYQTFDEAGEMLSHLNYKAVKRSLYKLYEQGFIESLKNWTQEPIITQAGLKRLRSLLPEYQEKRLWSGKLYLINYDLSSRQNYLRDRLREFLRRLGAIKLQDSLYLVANNPYKFVEQFKEENHPQGIILVSELGKKGFMGEEDLKRFLWEGANLDCLNERYQEFIQKWKKAKGKIIKTQLALEYYSILQDDPQLPFELLPDDYLGDEAYLLFQKLLRKIP